MTISAKDWAEYIRKLSGLHEQAAKEMREYVLKNGFGDMSALTDYAYALATKYGEGAGALAAAMYDATAEMEGKLFDPAEIAETADYQEVAKTVQGVAKQSQNANLMGNAVGRLVKRTGADTTLKNALRDGAEFAWVPAGDTCAFCITLASRGWQRASKAAIKGGHAEHIHSNCDCTYAIRFDGKSSVAGYDPDKYLQMYEDAEGDTWQEKVNSMRREQYAENRERINEQKRAAYAERKGKEHGRRKARELLEYKAPNGITYKVHGNDVVLDYNQHEKEIADLLSEELGDDVYLVPRVNNPQGIRTPDYLIHGDAYDLKTINDGAGENTIFNRIKKASGQSSRLVIDVSKSGLNDEIIDSQLEKVFWSQNTQFVEEVIIIKDGKIRITAKRKK